MIEFCLEFFYIFTIKIALESDNDRNPRKRADT